MEHCERCISILQIQLEMCDIKRNIILYLILVRSKFEYCSQIWHPTSNGKTMIDNFETIQDKKINSLSGFSPRKGYHIAI